MSCHHDTDVFTSLSAATSTGPGGSKMYHELRSKYVVQVSWLPLNAGSTGGGVGGNLFVLVLEGSLDGTTWTELMGIDPSFGALDPSQMCASFVFNPAQSSAVPTLGLRANLISINTMAIPVTSVTAVIASEE